MTSEDAPSSDDARRAASVRLGKPRRSRSWAVAGVVSLAAALGAGAYLTTSALVRDEPPLAQEFQPIPPGFTPGDADPSPAAGLTLSSDAIAEPATSAAPTAATAPRRQEGNAAAQAAQPETREEVRKKIIAAREAAEKDGFPLRRPLEPTDRAGAGPAVTETTQHLAGGGTMRITTAKGDLTGRRPLNWAADDGEAVGANRCTHKFRFSDGDPGSTRPTMLLCWRTSASRSVAVLSVDPGGTPSAEDSAVAIDREWKKLG